jgi:hypothetical protein
VPFATSLNQGVKNETIVIDSAPKPVFLAGDADDHFVKTPDVVLARSFASS